MAQRANTATHRRKGRGGFCRPIARLAALCVLALGAVGAWHPALAAENPTPGTRHLAPDTRHPPPGTRHAEPISPSQVLVLYNADWTGDAPLTDPGQDSKEIAEHYVRRHTDPATGEKPYLLGLRCVHGKNHLNAPEIAEASKDNASGVVLRQGGKVVGSAGEMRDSRGVELILPKAGVPWRVETLRVELRPAGGEPLVLVEGGQSLHGPRVGVQSEGEWHIRTDGRSFVQGPFQARASCEDAEGRLHRWEAEYQDVLDVSCSRTGSDGVRDDQNYLDDVETQVKAYLEDPKNALPDGTLLKDHVLFLVLAYGLPKTAPATYGIARGVNNRLGDHGPTIDLGQRLQVMYYDIEGALGFVPRTHKFRDQGPFTAYWFRAPQAWALEGRGANPFLHPDAYRKGARGPQTSGLAFTRENRARFPGRHLFFVSRLDGMTPLEARGLADRTRYAGVFAGPAMGLPEEAPAVADEKEVKALDTSKAAAILRALGYRRLGYSQPGSRLGRLDFLRLRGDSGFFNRDDVFLPGGIAAKVISDNLWGGQRSALRTHLAQGVTVTAGGAWIRRKSAHIHDKSWWDDRLLYPMLLAGEPLGAVLLANQIHLEWVTSFVADPLYRLPPVALEDHTPPEVVWARDVRSFVRAGTGGEEAVWVRVDLPQAPNSPEVAQMRLTSDGTTALCQTFEARPYALLGRPEEVFGKEWTLELLDPYGNRFTTRGKFER